MAYSILNFVSTATDSGSYIEAPNFTATAGSCLLAIHWGGEPSNNIVTLSDQVGSNDSWTTCGTDLNYGITYARAFYLLNAASGSCTIRATNSQYSNTEYFAVVEISGIKTASALAAYVAGTSNNPGTGTDAVTTGNTSSLTEQPAGVFAFSFNENGTSIPGAGTGYTTDAAYAVHSKIRFEHKRVTATDAVAGTFTASVGTNAYMSTVIALAEGSTQSNAPRAAHLMKLMRG